MKRFRATLAVLALLALAILLFRPMVLDTLDLPFGARNSVDVKLASAEGSPHCALLADCETVSIGNVGLNLSSMGFLLVLAGVVMAVRSTRERILHAWTALVPNPPPLSALS